MPSFRATPPASPATALLLPGTSGNYVSTPDAPALDITGDLEIVARLALVDWTPSVGGTIVSKRSTNHGLAFQLGVNPTTGDIAFSLTTGAASQFNDVRGTNPGFVDGQMYWIRMTRVAATGVTTWGYAPDQPNEPSAYSLMVREGNVTPGLIDANDAPVEIGSNRGGAFDLLAAKVARVILRDGIGGTTVADYRADVPATRFQDAAGRLWTVNGAAWHWCLP